MDKQDGRKLETNHLTKLFPYGIIKKKGGDNMKENSAPGNRLRELRDRSRLTLQEVSILTGFGIATISRHESGGRSLSEEAISKYAALYKVPSHQIFVAPSYKEEDMNDGNNQ